MWKFCGLVISGRGPQGVMIRVRLRGTSPLRVSPGIWAQAVNTRDSSNITLIDARIRDDIALPFPRWINRDPPYHRVAGIIATGRGRSAGAGRLCDQAYVPVD